MKNINKTRGFTLFIAILVTGVLLLITAGVTSLATRHAQIASSGQSSQHAFYAADTGLECALYWDVKNPAGFSAFSTSTPSSIYCNDPPPLGPAMVVGGGGDENPTSSFSFTLSPDSYCVVVTVNKVYSGSPLVLVTTIESKGYNTCAPLNPRRVERAVRARY